jgi:hypothetical protein
MILCIPADCRNCYATSVIVTVTTVTVYSICILFYLEVGDVCQVQDQLRPPPLS